MDETRQVLNLLVDSTAPLSPVEISHRTGIAPGVVATVLPVLTLRGLIRACPGPGLRRAATEDGRKEVTAWRARQRLEAAEAMREAMWRTKSKARRLKACGE